MKTIKISMFALVLSFAQTGVVSADDTFLLQGANYIRLIEPEALTRVNNQHPYSFSSDEICALLGSIEIRYEETKFFFFDREVASQAMFNEKELNTLCRILPKAFAAATPRQDVAFAISSQRTAPSGIGSNTLLTSARVFVQDDMLHLIFSKVRVDYNRLLDREYYGEKMPKSDYIPRRKMEINPIEPGLRNRESKQDWRLVPGNSIAYNDDRSDWIRIDIQRLLAEKFPVQKQLDQSASTAKPDAEVSTHHDDVIEPVPKRKLTIEQRLRELKELHEKGLITEDVYHQKMRNIIEEL